MDLRPLSAALARARAILESWVDFCAEAVPNPLLMDLGQTTCTDSDVLAEQATPMPRAAPVRSPRPYRCKHRRQCGVKPAAIFAKGGHDTAQPDTGRESAPLSSADTASLVAAGRRYRQHRLLERSAGEFGGIWALGARGHMHWMGPGSRSRFSAAHTGVHSGSVPVVVKREGQSTKWSSEQVRGRLFRVVLMYTRIRSTKVTASLPQGLRRGEGDFRSHWIWAFWRRAK